MKRLHGLILGAIAGAIIQSAGSSEACPEIKIPVLGQVIYSTCARVTTVFTGALGATKGAALGYVGVAVISNWVTRRKLRPVNPLTGTDYEEFDWDILGYASLGAIFLSVSFGQPVKTITTKIRPQTKPAINTKIANLFDSPKSLGSLAICHSEGNCLADGTKTSRYNRHVDPGDLRINGGYCSTSFPRQGKKGIATLAALEKLCQEENQADAKIVYNAFLSKGLKPEQHLEAFINGVDFANQARNEHAVQFVADYSRNPNKSMGELRTQSSYLKLGGLHFACRNWTKQTKQAVGVTNVRSPQEKWRCVHYDQTRRAKAIIATLNHHSVSKKS